jgi:hypothetical protein
MKKRFFLFGIIVFLVVSLVPLSGVSAQRATSASSAAMSGVSAPSARTIYSKDIKTQLVYYCGGVKCFKLALKTNWTYDKSTILSHVTIANGVSFQSNWEYRGPAWISDVGGVGMTYSFHWVEGTFRKASSGGYVYVYLDIWQGFFADGTWDAYKFYYKD